MKSANAIILKRFLILFDEIKSSEKLSTVKTAYPIQKNVMKSLRGEKSKWQNKISETTKRKTKKSKNY